MRTSALTGPPAAAQNLSAGIILAAVASELFPLLAKAKGVKAGFGLVVGFVAGLATVFGVEHIASKFEVRVGCHSPTRALHALRMH